MAAARETIRSARVFFGPGRTRAQVRSRVRMKFAAARRLGVLAFSVATAAAAQSPIPTFDLERFSFNPGARETMTVGSGDLLEARRLRLSLIGHVQSDPLVFTVDDQRVGAAVGARVSAHLMVAYGVFDRLEVGLQLPVILFQRGDDLSALGVSPVASAGMGAPVLHGRIGVLRQSKGAPLDLGVTASVAIPIGSVEALARDADLGLSFHPRVGAGYSFGTFRAGGELGVLVRGNQVLSPTSSTIADEVGSGFSFGAVLSTTKELAFLRGEFGVRGSVPFTRSGVSVELLGGVRASFLEDDSLEVSLLGGPGFGGAPGTPAARIMFGVTWAPSFAEKKKPDTDGDGVDDENDRCPRKPAKTKDGYPVADADRDGIEDFLDACPNESGVERLNGCPEP